MSLVKDYRQKVLPALMKKLGFTNIYQTPHLDKVVVNVGIGTYVLKQDKNFESVVSDISAITGQKPVIIKARLAVSNFKLRKGMPNGVKVTLRGDQMLSFLDRLIHVALPRTRDFHGVSRRAFDGNGNYSMGITEATIFPEIRIDDLRLMYSFQVNISTTAKNNEEGEALLEEIGIPFVKKK